jgi:hypothetical protein
MIHNLVWCTVLDVKLQFAPILQTGAVAFGRTAQNDELLHSLASCLCMHTWHCCKHQTAHLTGTVRVRNILGCNLSACPVYSVLMRLHITLYSRSWTTLSVMCRLARRRPCLARFLGCSYVFSVGECVKSTGDLPQKAAPIVKEMLDLLERANDKLEKYKARNQVQKLYYAKSEEVGLLPLDCLQQTHVSG